MDVLRRAFALLAIAMTVSIDLRGVADVTVTTRG
jgi:hypothetical protein